MDKDNFDNYQDGFAQEFADANDGKKILQYITQRDPKYKTQALKTAQKRQTVLNLTEKDMLIRLGKQAGHFLKNEAKIQNGQVVLSGYAEHLLFPSKENSLKLDAGFYQGKRKALENQAKRQMQKQKQAVQEKEKQAHAEPTQSPRFNEPKHDDLGL